MSADIDGAALDRWLTREPEDNETCGTCDGSGWLYHTFGDGEVVKDGCPDCAEEERAQDAEWARRQGEER